MDEELNKEVDTLKEAIAFWDQYRNFKEERLAFILKKMEEGLSSQEMNKQWALHIARHNPGLCKTFVYPNAKKNPPQLWVIPTGDMIPLAEAKEYFELFCCSCEKCKAMESVKGHFHVPHFEVQPMQVDPELHFEEGEYVRGGQVDDDVDPEIKEHKLKRSANVDFREYEPDEILSQAITSPPDSPPLSPD